MKSRDARSTALAVLDAVARTDTLATAALRREAERNDLPSEVTALANELVTGVFRRRTLLDEVLSRAVTKGLPKGDRRLLDVLRMAAYEMLFLDSVPDYATVSAFVNLARATKGPQIGGFVNAVLRKVAGMDRAALLEEAKVGAAELRYSMPSWLVEAMRRAFPQSWEAELAAINLPAPIGVHVNPKRGTAQGLLQELEESGVKATAVPGLPMALRISHKTPPYQTPAFVQGRFWPQDLASQFVAHVAASAAPGRWLDACCGVGTKTLALRAETPEAQLEASDPSATRVESLGQRVASLGLGPVQARVQDLLEMDVSEAPYSLVLVDAPCSGLGTIRHHPELRWRRRPEDVDRNARLQSHLLAKAASLVAPGGMLAYAVCSFTFDEGTQVVSRFLESGAPFEPSARAAQAAAAAEKAGLSGGNAGLTLDAVGGLLLPPSLLDSDAFYACFLQRKSV